MIKTLFSRFFGDAATCKTVDGFLAEYLEGTLDENTARRFEDHIASCPACIKYLEQYKQTIELTRTDAVEIPDALAEKTLTFLKKNLR